MVKLKFGELGGVCTAVGGDRLIHDFLLGEHRFWLRLRISILMSPINLDLASVRWFRIRLGCALELVGSH